jgi:hypothetical protein
MADRRKSKVLKNGRNDRTTRFARLDLRVVNSRAYRALSTSARALLVEFASIFDGRNNGSLYLSVDDAMRRLGFSDVNAARAALDELQDMGFIVMTRDSYYSIKAADKSRARCWRLTFERGPGQKHATMDFEKCEPTPGSRERKRMERGLRALADYHKARDLDKIPVLETNILDPLLREPVLETNTAPTQICASPSNVEGEESNTHSELPWGTGAQRSVGTVADHALAPDPIVAPQRSRGRK